VVQFIQPMVMLKPALIYNKLELQTLKKQETLKVRQHKLVSSFETLSPFSTCRDKQIHFCINIFILLKENDRQDEKNSKR